MRELSIQQSYNPCLNCWRLNSLMPAILDAGHAATQDSPFLPRNHRQYSLHLPTKGWPGWVGLDK